MAPDLEPAVARRSRRCHARRLFLGCAPSAWALLRRTTRSRFTPAGIALTNCPQMHVTDGGARYVRSLLSPPHFRRCKRQPFSDRQTL